MMTPQISALLLELFSLYQLILAGMAGEGGTWMAVVEAGAITPSNMRLSPLGVLTHELLGLEKIDPNSEMLQITVRVLSEASRLEVSMVSIDGGSVTPTSMLQGQIV